MLWICNSCTAAYSPGAPRCPQCGSTDHREQGDPMPKITVQGGPTNAAAGPAITGGEWGDPTDDAAASAEPSTVAEPDGQAPAEGYDPDNLTYPYGGGDPYTEGPDGTQYYEPKTLESGGGGTPLPVVGDTDDAAVEAEVSFDYEACTVAQLREFLTARALPTTGLKPELVARLTEDDAEPASVKTADES